VKCTEVQWSDDLGWNVYIIINLQLCSSVQYVVSLLYASICYFIITRLMFLILLSCLFFVFYFVYFVFLHFFGNVLCIFSPSVYSCLFPSFVQVYRPLTPDGNPIAVNKYHKSSYHIISFHIFSPCKKNSLCTCIFKLLFSLPIPVLGTGLKVRHSVLCVHTCTYVCMYVRTYVCIMYIRTYVCMHLCMYVYIYIHK